MGRTEDATKLQNELIETIEKYYGDNGNKSLPLPKQAQQQQQQQQSTQSQSEIVNNNKVN